jgi:transposase
MANDFRPYQMDQLYLLPVSAREWLSDDHLGLFVADVVSQLDLRPILRAYRGGRGPRGYHPQMLLTVLVYGYCIGVFSSRKLAARCETDVAFRVLSGGSFPDFRTLSDYRKRHLGVMSGLFIDVLGMCREAGLVKVGHVSLDGSKYQANASKHKAMSYGRIGEAEPRLAAEIKGLLDEAERIDREEDALYGRDRRGDELPKELRRREGRLAKIQEAKKRLEERAEGRAREREEAKGATPEEIAAAEERARPGAKEQSNFTDPDSRIMKTRNGWVQGFNAQVVVNEEGGLILAEAVSAQAADSPHLVPMAERMDANLAEIGMSVDERKPGAWSGDAGYCSESNLAALAERGIDAYVATGRERHHRGGVDPHRHPRTPLRAAMREKLQTEAGRAIYARRKCITEPVHGMIKGARGFRQFLLRGLDNVRAEFTLVALTSPELAAGPAPGRIGGCATPAAAGRRRGTAPWRRPGHRW